MVELEPLAAEIKAPRRELYLVTDAQATTFRNLSEKARLAMELAKEDQMVIFGTLNRDTDDVEVISKLQDHLYLMNQDLFPFLPHMATPEETTIYIGGPMDAPAAELLHPSRRIVEIEGLSHHEGSIPKRADAVVVRLVGEVTPAQEPGLENVVFLKAGEEARAAKDLLTVLDRNDR